MGKSRFFRRHVAIPAEHGAWVFLFSPLIIGLFAGGRLTLVSVYLAVAALCGFMIRHPVTLVIKVQGGRRPRDTLPAAWFWIGVYAAVGGLHVLGLVLRGYAYVLWLALPGVPVFLWHLDLVRRRAERRQWLVEIAGAGALALTAPAALWVGLGRPDPIGWWLWLLAWAQSAASIVYAYLRLAQRAGERGPVAAALSFAAFNTAGTAALGYAGVVSPWLFVPYLLQLAEVVFGISRPAKGLKPKAIGMRQLAVSTIFTVLFVLLWR